MLRQHSPLSIAPLAALLLLLVGFGCEDKSIDPPDPPPATPDLAVRLANLPGMTVTEIDPVPGTHFTRAFDLALSQPVDHNSPAGQAFTQPIYIQHLGFDRPTVLVTTGYAVRPNYLHELSPMLDANQVYVNHRYIAEAVPDPINWTHLTAEQIAADYHRIVEMLKPIYPGPWVNTGISKGGITTLIHRRFHPDDVVASVAYVAPIMFDTADFRFDNFLLDEVGDAACRNRLKNFQRAVLLRRDSLMPLVAAEVASRGYTYRYGLETSFDIGLMEFLFYFWQYGPNDCTSIPDSSNSTAEIYAFYNGMADPYWLHDGPMDFFGPVYYQLYTEMGYYRLIDDHLADLLAPPTAPSYSMFAPAGVPLTWRPEVMVDINSWLQTEGNNIIYIYGGIDPYTAAAITLPGAANALRVIEPGLGHGTRIVHLTFQQAAVLDSLEAWVGVEVAPPAIAPMTIEPISLRGLIESMSGQ